MIITIADEVFDGLDASGARDRPRAARQLLWLADEGRHRLLIEPEYDPGAARHVNDWLAQLSALERDAFELALDRSMRDETRFPLAVAIRVDDIAEADFTAHVPVLPLADALALARRPLSVFVEDWQSDGDFLRRMAAPGLYREDWEKALANDWLRIEHGGGLPGFRRRIVDVQNGDHAARWRMWILFDSDAKEKGVPSPEVQELKVKCQDSNHPIAHHCLERRAIENYIPLAALDQYTAKARGKRVVFEAFCRMTADQRNHYNMKKGFEGDRKHAIPAHFGQHQDHPRLQVGFGRNIWKKVCECVSDPFPESWLHEDGSLEEAKTILKNVLERI